MINSIDKRKRRTKKIRAKISNKTAIRLTVHRSNSHIYAQLIDTTGSKVLTSSSTLEPEVRKSLNKGGNVEAASLVGRRIAEKAKTQGIKSVSFDRSGYKYHGRVKALAEAARENGLAF
jgi:large subunit ribosomal protein L18